VFGTLLVGPPQGIVEYIGIHDHHLSLYIYKRAYANVNCITNGL